ncbi:MAG: type II secretion system F family protein [Burkholderiales bacterium]
MNAAMLDQLENLLALAVLGLITLAFVLARRSPRHRIAQRAKDLTTRYVVHAGLDDTAQANSLGQRLLHRFASVGDRFPIFDAAQRAKLALQLTRAGFRSKRSVSVLVGIKLVFGLGTALQLMLAGSHVPVMGQHALLRIIAVMGAVVVGMIVPEYMLRWISKRRQRRIAAFLPDALDLLVICTNAGNSLAVGLRRVAHEMASICAPLSQELAITADELQMSGETSAALRNMCERIGLASVNSLVSTLIQSQQYGTPITQALRTLSRAERHAHIIALEEKAAKLAPKITLPMMLFILPTVILIAAGPAVLSLMKAFK